MRSAGRIYLDFDDVLCETALQLAELHHEMHDRRVAYDDIHAFDLSESFGLDADELQALMIRAHEDDFLMALACTDGAAEGVRELAAMGCEPVIVTGRPAHCYRASRAWLEAHCFPELPILYVDKYGREPGHVDPLAPQPLGVDALLRETFAVAVDDSPMALDLLHGRVDYPLVVFDRPWNRGYRDGANVHRVERWGELCAMVRTLTAE